MVIRGFNVGPLLRKTWSEIGEDRVMSLSAETAYYFFFSLFPLLLFLTPLLGLLGNGRELMGALITRLSHTVPADALSLLSRTLGEIAQGDGKAGVMSLGALLAGWSGSNIFGALMEALNVAYDVTDTRPWWKRQLLRIACLLIAGFVVIAATTVFLDGERFASWMGDRYKLEPITVALISGAQLFAAFCLIVGLCVMLYKLLPNVRQRWLHVIISAICATTLWVIATLLFRLYVQNFGSYNKTYGTIGGVIALLTWMYYTMLVFLAGGELASELHHGSGAVDPLKGATYLGRIVTDSGPGKVSAAAD